jgi:hypothetical protein
LTPPWPVPVFAGVGSAEHVMRGFTDPITDI